MGKKRFDHRLLACVARGKCVEGVELPVIDPGANVVEGRIDASRGPRKKATVEKKVTKSTRISDERIIELFENWNKRNGNSARAVGLGSEEGENSVDIALKMLCDKARHRAVNKLGAELEDIKDRMVNVVEDYEDLLELSPYACPLDVEADEMLENNDLIPWKNAVSNMIFGYENKCREREKVLANLSENMPTNESGIKHKEEAPSIGEDDIEELERAGSEMVENLEKLQIKTRKLNFLHYNILKSNSRGQTDGVNLKAHREIDLQGNVVGRFSSITKERQNREDAWKYAAEEIVGLLKSVRKEGNHKLGELEESFKKLLETFKRENEELERLNNDLRIQKQTVTMKELEQKKTQDDNLLLQDNLDKLKKEKKIIEEISNHLKQRLKAHLDEVDDEDLYKPVAADDKEGKEIIYIKRTKKIKADLKRMEEENQKLKTENGSLQKKLDQAKLSTEGTVQESKVPLTCNEDSNSENCLECTILSENLNAVSSELTKEQERSKSLEEELVESQLQIRKINQESKVPLTCNEDSNSENCLECTILSENLNAVLSELTKEQERSKSLEEELAESQLQIRKINQIENDCAAFQTSTMKEDLISKELLQQRIQNSKIIQMSQKFESAIPSTVSLQSCQSTVSAHPSCCPPEVSNDQLSSADESGYTSNEISTGNLGDAKGKNKNDRMVHQAIQTEDLDSLDKAVQVMSERAESSKMVDTNVKNMEDLNRMAREKTFDEDFTGALGRQVATVCNNIVNLTGLVDLIRSRPSPGTPDIAHVIREKSSSDEFPRNGPKLENEPKDFPTTPFDVTASEPQGNTQSLEEDGHGSEKEAQKLNLEKQELTNEKADHNQPTKESTRESPSSATGTRTLKLGEKKEKLQELPFHRKPRIHGNDLQDEMMDPNENSPVINIAAADALGLPKQQTGPIDISANTKPQMDNLPVIPKAGTKRKLSIINLDLPKDLRSRRGQQQLRPRSHLNYPHSRSFTPKHDFQQSFTDLQRKIETINEDSDAVDASQMDLAGEISNGQNTDELSARGRAWKVINALREFAMASWHHLEVVTGEITEDLAMTQEDVLHMYLKLIAEHAYKILQIIGVSLWKVSMNEKNNLESASKEGRRLSPFNGLPQIIKAKEEIVSRLITDKSSIWLPMIAVTGANTHQPEQSFSRDQIGSSAAKSKLKITEKHTQEGLALPAISKSNVSIMANRTKKMLGIGGHQLISSKADTEEKKPSVHTKTKAAPNSNSSKRSYQTDFRSPRVLVKNKTLATLLKQSGKTVDEISVILGASQGVNKQTLVGNAERGGENDLDIGLTSRHINLPKLKYSHQVRPEDAKAETKTNPRQQTKRPRKTSTLSALQVNKSKGTGLPAFGSSWKQVSPIPSETHLTIREEASKELNKLTGPNEVSQLIQQRQAPRFLGRQRIPLMTHGVTKRQSDDTGPLDIAVASQSHETQNMPLNGVTEKRASLFGANQFGKHLKESLVTQRRQRRMSYAVQQKTSAIELPNLEQSEVAPTEKTNDFD